MRHRNNKYYTRIVTTRSMNLPLTQPFVVYQCSCPAFGNGRVTDDIIGHCRGSAISKAAEEYKIVSIILEVHELSIPFSRGIQNMGVACVTSAEATSKVSECANLAQSSLCCARAHRIVGDVTNIGLG